MPNDEDRRNNLDGAFSCDGRLTGSCVLLIDDVVTTGSTISSCAEALKSSGASTVFGVALAREP
jgi:predicted amidophosphoribosyltransferase